MAEELKENIKKPNSGLAASFNRKTKRVINKDGTFNVTRTGTKKRVVDVFQHLINCSWSLCFIYIIVFYFGINLAFACIYSALGNDTLSSFDDGSFLDRIPNAFYFSIQTFTSVGYGGVVPVSHLGNLVSSVEALIGLVSVAIATGVLYGRFSKPIAKLEFSKWATFSPFKNTGHNSFQFRVVNKRNSQMMNLEATVMYTRVVEKNGLVRREYKRLDLELNKILFFPLSWTIVHPIKEDSPIYGKHPEDFEAENGEFLVYIKGFDEVYGSEVNVRYSYLFNEIKHNQQFVRNFETREDGIIEMNLDAIGEIERIQS